MLSKSDASLDAKDNHGFTPLPLVVTAGSPMMISNLVDIGAYEYAQNNAGKTRLDLAKAKRTKEVVNIIGGEPKKRRYWRA